MSTQTGIGRIVNITSTMSEHLRDAAYARRADKVAVLLEALEAFYVDESQSEYEPEQPMGGQFFVRLPADATGKLEAHARVSGVPMSEVIRRALAKDINAHNHR